MSALFPECILNTAKAAFAICVAILPLAFLPVRFEAHETYRAGLLLVLVAFALPGLWRIRHANRFLLLAILGWAAALILSTGFALSFSRAFLGDLIRDMGLITQLTLIAVIFLGSTLDPAAAWRWFWLGGVVVAAYVILQAAGFIPNPLAERAYGPLGAPTYTGGWLALAALWTIPGFLSRPTRRDLLVITAGTTLMLVALLLTGSRGALLAVGAGFLVAILVWTAAHGKCAIAFALVVFIVGGAGGLFFLDRMDWQNSPLSTLPLIARLNPDLPDTPRAAREKIWTGTLQITNTWPTLMTSNAERDPFASLRRLFGYGLESFELVFRPHVDDELRLFESGHPVDRAHNDWLDTLIGAGWFGLLTRASLWLTALYISLQRLRLAGMGFLLFVTAGVALGIIASWNSPLLPLAATIGGLAALVLWLALQSFTPHSVTIDLRVVTALAVITAHMMDLQFFFTTVATAVPAYLALGLILLPEQSGHAQTDDEPGLWLWAGFGGAFLLRALVMLNADFPAYALLVGMIVVVCWFAPMTRRDAVQIVLLWLVGWGAGHFQTPEIVALIDVILLLWLLARFSSRNQWHRSRVISALLIVLALALFASDTVASIDLNRANQSSVPSASAADLQIAARLRPWDDRVWALAGSFALEATLNQLDAPNAAALNQAAAFVERAIQLSPYDAGYYLTMAEIELHLASVIAEKDNHLQKALDNLLTAQRLWPNNPENMGVWCDWSQFYESESLPLNPS
jgi:O-antigen ligase/polysaccharide polymerase Wzy-like membrane protein